MIYSADNSRFWIDDFKVTQSLEKGDRLLYTMEMMATDATSLPFNNLSNDDTKLFAYSLTSVYTRYTERCKSDQSEIKYVDLTTTGAETIEAEEITLIPVEGGIMVITTKATNLSIYSVDGTTKYNGALIAGANMIPLASGIYIVHSDSSSKKVIVK